MAIALSPFDRGLNWTSGSIRQGAHSVKELKAIRVRILKAPDTRLAGAGAVKLLFLPLLFLDLPLLDSFGKFRINKPAGAPAFQFDSGIGKLARFIDPRIPKALFFFASFWRDQGTKNSETDPR